MFGFCTCPESPVPTWTAIAVFYVRGNRAPLQITSQGRILALPRAAHVTCPFCACVLPEVTVRRALTLKWHCEQRELIDPYRAVRTRFDGTRSPLVLPEHRCHTQLQPPCAPQRQAAPQMAPMNPSPARITTSPPHPYPPQPIATTPNPEAESYTSLGV